MNYLQRIQNLQQLIKETNLDCLIIDAPIDLLYLTGLSLSLGRLVLKLDESMLFVDGRYIETCKQNCPIPSRLTKKQAIPSFIFQNTSDLPQKIAFDSQFTTYESYKSLSKEIGAPTKNFSLVPWPNPTESLRCIKDREELVALRKAAELGSQGFDFARSLLQLGVSEKKVAAELEIFWKQNGSEKPAFDINISFGSNSSMPHHRASTRCLKRGDTVLMDIGVSLDHYNSDMTRALFFGEPPQEMKKIYEIVLQAQQASLAICRPGTQITELDQVSRSLIKDAGYGDFYTHSLGHGIGLNVHESPILKNSKPYNCKTLETGMVITIEPGIYLPNLGGIRIEDTIAITKSGYEDLTRRPKELTII